MTEDDAHEAAGAMLHRGLVEQRQYEKDMAAQSLEAEIERLQIELDKARDRIKQLEYRVNYLERW